MQNPTVEFVTGYKGIKLYHKFYRAIDSKVRILFLHGAGEYSGKYARFAEWFAGRAIDVHLMDLRGHGSSEGLRCHTDDFNEFVLDLDIVIKSIEKNEGHKTTFIVSHSIGGLISLFYTLQFPYKLKGIVVCSPCLDLKLKVQPIKAWLANNFYPMLKNRSFSSHIKPQMATHDSYILEKFKNDPLIHHAVTASFYVQMVRAMRYVNKHADEVRVPILILQAGDDSICDAQMAERFYQSAGSEDKDFKLYEELYHELLNELGKEKVFQDIYNWIEQRSK